MGRLKRPALLFWVVVSLTVGGLLNTLPLLETLGYEYALFSAILASFAAGHLGALAPSQARGRGAVGFGRLYLGVVASASLPPLILLILSLMNGIRVPFCNVWQGLGFFVLMPLAGVPLAAAMGLAVGLATRGRVRATLLWSALFLSGVAAGVYSFYATPAVYLFHPFAGYYPGVLYDRLIAVDSRLVSYRVVTLVQSAAILSTLRLLYRPGTVALSVRHFVLASGRTYTAAGLVALSWTLHLAGPLLGHRTDRDALIEALPVHIATERLDIYFPTATDARLRETLTADARFSLHQVERYLGVRSAERISVFFFRDTAHKGALIGAAETNVAKPWRREVYVVLEAPPHGILRHELVHAVSANFGRGPFRIAGAGFGLLPNPALIEGLATAAGGLRGDLTVHQWAAAMASLGLMPPLEKLFGLGFFDVPAGAAYTAAGSFCDFIKETYGAKALREAYRRSDFEGATGKSLGDLAAAWREMLRAVELRPSDLAVAEQRFDRTPVVRTVCVHEVARICGDAAGLATVGAFDAAWDRYTLAHRKSGGAPATFRNLLWVAKGAGDEKQLRALLKEMVHGKGFNRADVDLARELTADQDRVSGKAGDYAALYRELAAAAGSLARARRLLIKAYLVDADGSVPSTLVDALSPSPLGGSTQTLLVAALTIAEAALRHPADPVLQYLLARQYFNAGDFVSAKRCLDSATGMRALLPLVYIEVEMLRGRSLYHLKRLADAKQVFDRLARDARVRVGTRARARDWSDRCYFERGGGAAR